jgi:hypothetical protein
MKTDGHETNNDSARNFRLSDCVFRGPKRFDCPPHEPGIRIIRERSLADLKSENFDRRRSSRQVQEGRPNRNGRVRPEPEMRTCRRPSPFPSGSKHPAEHQLHAEASLREAVGIYDVLRPLGPEAMAGILREIPANKLLRLGNRIYGSSVQSVSGRRRPGWTAVAAELH